MTEKEIIKQNLTKSEVWPEVQAIIKKLLEKGYQAFVVGGAIRDSLLGQSPKDIDLAVSARPDEIVKMFPLAHKKEKYLVTFISLKKGSSVTLASFRSESVYQDGRRPEKVFFTSMKKDVERRDFTVNALFYDSQNEKLIDLKGGLKDLKNKIIRTVGHAEKSFKEDHLRVIRALRLAHQLGFSLEEQTQKAIIQCSSKIKRLSKECILNELVKIFSVGQMGMILKSFDKYKVFSYLFPEILSPFPVKYHKKPFVFWNQKFSFYKDPAFCWTVFGAPFFYNEIFSFVSFLKKRLVSSKVLKDSQNYLKGLVLLTSESNSFTEKLRILEGKKEELFELSSFWLKSQGKSLDSLKDLIREFEKREKKGFLPKALVTGFDILKYDPDFPRHEMSLFLKRAFDYQMKYPTVDKSQILKKILK